MKYIEKTSKLIKDYFSMLSPNYPDWLDEYIETERMLKQQYISVTCGKIYSKLFDYNDYSSLEHSIAVALIIWNFTHDKKQTLSGLFHDIAIPAFKHCIDFLNGDYMNQESTADRLEYSLSNDLIAFKTNTLEDIREIYNDIEVQTNENEIIELGFKTKKIARQFVKNTSRLSLAYRDDATRFYMQAIKNQIIVKLLKN